MICPVAGDAPRKHHAIHARCYVFMITPPHQPAPTQARPMGHKLCAKTRGMLDATHVHSQLVTNGRHVFCPCFFVQGGCFYYVFFGFSRWVHVCHVSLPTHQRYHKTGPWRRTSLCPYIKHVMCLFDICGASLRPMPLAGGSGGTAQESNARASPNGDTSALVPAVLLVKTEDSRRRRDALVGSWHTLDRGLVAGIIR